MSRLVLKVRALPNNITVCRLRIKVATRCLRLTFLSNGMAHYKCIEVHFGVFYIYRSIYYG